LTNRIEKGLIDNGKKYDAKKYPFVVTNITTIAKPDGIYSERSCTGALVK